MAGSKKVIRLDFSDFYYGYSKTHNYFHRLLSERYDLEISDKPDFLIYSHEGDHHKIHNCVKIFFTVESIEPNFSECDYSLTCHYLDDPRHLRFPIYPMYGDPSSISKERIDMQKLLAEKTRFCSFIVSNPNLKKTRRRIAFFEKLSAYKKVDSGGKVFNNLGYQVPGSSEEKVAFLKHYKFNLCFENKYLPGYTTEKIFEAMQAICVPIYWGNPKIGQEFNTRSFLNYEDFGNDDALIEKIIELDQNEAAYSKVLQQPYFTGGQPNEFFSRERLLDFFGEIFENGPGKKTAGKTFFTFGRWKLVRQHKPNRSDKESNPPTPVRRGLWTGRKILGIFQTHSPVQLSSTGPC